MRRPFALCRKAFDTPLGALAPDLEALDALPVPGDAAERANLLRKALARPARASSARFSEQWGDPPSEGFVATPVDYDPSRIYPTVLSLSAYCADPHQSLTSFALPREEWDEIRQGRSLEPAKPTPGVPCPSSRWWT